LREVNIKALSCDELESSCGEKDSVTGKDTESHMSSQGHKDTRSDLRVIDDSNRLAEGEDEGDSNKNFKGLFIFLLRLMKLTVSGDNTFEDIDLLTNIPLRRLFQEYKF
jgi:hypothetical protein